MDRVRDVVVRVLLRRRPPTDLPPKSQLPIAEYVYCYGPLDPDEPDGPSDWHWAPRKDFFDRSAEATLEYYAPMSSSLSVNELPRSRRSSVSERRPGRRASGALGDKSGAYTGELDERLKQSKKTEIIYSAALSSSVGCTEDLGDPEPGFRSPPAPLAATQGGVFTIAVNVPCPSDYRPPPRLSRSGCMAPLKSILKMPKQRTPALLPVSPPSPVVHPQYIPSPPPHPAQMPFLPPPLIPLVHSLPFIPSHSGPASLVGPSPPSSSAVELPIIPPFPLHSAAPFPSPPSIARSPPAPLIPQFVHADPRLFDPAIAHPINPPFPVHAARSPPHVAGSPPVRSPLAHASAAPAPLAPPPPPSPSYQPLRRLHASRNCPQGYAGGVSSLLAAPGELRFCFRSPEPLALLRRRLNLTQRVPVPLSDPALAESAFYPTDRDVLLVLPQLPWAVSLSTREGSGYLSVGDVLGALREHMGARVGPAEREMLRAAGHFGARWDALGDRSWLLGMWEDADAVRRVVGAGQDDFVRGRRCFVVLFGGEEETMC